MASSSGGREHLSLIRMRLEEAGLRRPGAAAPAGRRLRLARWRGRRLSAAAHAWMYSRSCVASRSAV